MTNTVVVSDPAKAAGVSFLEIGRLSGRPVTENSTSASACETYIS